MTVPDDTTVGPTVGPYPSCEIPCFVDITNVGTSDNGFVIDQTISESPTYTCSSLNPDGLTSTIAHDDYYSAPLTVVDGDQNTTSTIANF